MKRTIRTVSVVLVAAMLASGCQSMSGGGNRILTPDEQRMREEASTYNQTMVEGALIGCLGGGGIGALAGGKNSRLEGALIGCGAGALLGAGAGAYIADKQQKYATQELQIDSMTADVRADNQRLGKLIASTASVTANDKARIAQIRQDLSTGRITMEQARTRMSAVDDNRTYLDNTIKELRKRKSTYSDAAQQMARNSNPTQVAALNTEINALESKIRELEADRDDLLNARSVSGVG